MTSSTENTSDVRYVKDVQAKKKQARDEEAADPLDMA